MIVNTTEGIYQNTLTIAQSVARDNLYGLYSCMVENSRGSSHRLGYFYGENNIHIIIIIYVSLFFVLESLHSWFGG